MFTKFDKAGAAAVGGAVTTLVMVFTAWDIETVGAIGTLVTTVLTYAVPNKEA